LGAVEEIREVPGRASCMDLDWIGEVDERVRLLGLKGWVLRCNPLIES
jgi:hypothetical protein